MKIAIDAMGGDHGAKITVLGAVEAVKEFDVNLILTGDEAILKNELSQYEYPKDKIEVIHCSEQIQNEDKPVTAIRRKKDSSMVVALNLVKEKKADAVVSAGNTGALLAGGLFILGRIKGIDRPALAPVYPTTKGVSVLIDGGANTDSKPRNFLEFGIMGNIYANKILGIKEPQVCTVNIGIEEGKGNAVTQEAFKACQKGPFQFKGNVEARDIPSGYADVILCDGFTGNIILKLTEGLATTIFSELKKAFLMNNLTKIGAYILKPSLKSFKKQFDYTEYGGAPFLGVNGVLIKAHGSSDAKALKNAIRQGISFVNNDVVGHIVTEIQNLEADLIE